MTTLQQREGNKVNKYGMEARKEKESQPTNPNLK